MTKSRVMTLGCRLNNHESAQIEQILSQLVIEQPVVVINTCAVTQSASRQSKQLIRSAKRHQPNAKVIVTGCLASVEPLDAMSDVDGVIKNPDKTNPSAWQKLLQPKQILKHQSIQARATRASVRIQTGCDHRCTFCIIPTGRGVSRSEPTEKVIKQIAALQDRGYDDITLTGVDITAWGADLPNKPTLTGLLRTILNHASPQLRLRLSSLDCIELDDDFAELFGQEQRLMPYLHVSFQSGSALILKRMLRRHGPDQALAFCDRLRQARPEIVFGADFITGFPTETEDHFQQTCDFIRKAGLTWLHVFPFSSRSGTPAARMPQVDGTIIKQRADRLRALASSQASRHLHQQLGRFLRFVAEPNLNGMMAGRADDYTPVVMIADRPSPDQQRKLCRARALAVIAAGQREIKHPRFRTTLAIRPSSRPRILVDS